MNNPFEQLNNLFNKPLMLPGEVSQVDHLSPEDKTLLRRIGLTSAQVQRDLLADAQIFYDRYNIYHQVEKALEHPIVGAAAELYANYCCLTGDTKIPLLDGRTLTIREILEEHKVGKENWVYSCDTNGKPQPAKIVNAVKQKHTPRTYRVWLDNGKFVDASDNHKFIKRDGSLCRTDELVVGDSLIPLHRTVSKNGYELVWDVAKGNWESTHKMVAQYSCDVNLKEANKDVVTNKKRGEAISRTKLLAPSYNHKITKIECIGEQVVYDIEVTGSHLFGLDAGIYISNTVFSPMHNATLWITSESPTYQKELTKLLDRIGIEEKIFDWSFTAGSYGDMFVKVNGIPGQGVISIDDSDHPINISRVDHEGVLIGYYKTPVGQAGDQQRLMAPWEYVHFRLLGGKKQRPQFGDQSYAEYRTVHLLTGLRSKQVTTRYGSSVIMNALAIYRRLRLAEDSLLIARLSRGLIRYVWKLKVNSANMEAVGELIDQYSRVLREARSMDTREATANFDSKENPMCCLRGDTEISLCNGQDISIKELVENSEDYIGKYVWSVNPETLHVEPKRILKAQKTRLNTQLVRVHLDNDQHVDCTPDHKFMLRDGSYREAQYLKAKDSLMPFYTKVPEKGLSGYKCIYDPGDNKHHYAHKLVVGKLPRGFVPHHLDFNKLNNDPSNFVICTRHDHHTVFHGKHTLETIEKIKKNQVAWLKDKTKETFPYLAEMGEQHSKFMREFYKTERGQKVIEKGLETRMERRGTLSTTPVGDAHPFYGKTWEELLGVEEAIRRKQDMRDRFSGENNPSKNPEVRKKISEHHKKNPPNPNGRPPIVKAFRTKWCICGCGEQFRADSRGNQRYIHGHNVRHQCKVMNHKVISVEWLSEKEDTYDINVDGNHNFSLTSGIFVHNSIEDIFIPVWDNVGDLTFDKIGGETDIRWIRDIEDLRQQLAAALRTPLPLLGAWLKEATGALGSQAIEKVDINFARMARKLQRTIRTGIKRICQIHLAYMNMDPDPNLFDVQMPEMSTAEEESLKESLKDGMEVVSSMMEVIGSLVEGTDKELDKIEIFNYLNEKILKLEDFDLKEYLVAIKAAPIVEPPIEELPEEEQPLERKRRETRDKTLTALREQKGMCEKRKGRMVHELKVRALLESAMGKEDKDRVFQKPCLFDTDLQSFVPTQIHNSDGTVNEKMVTKLGRTGGWLGIERCMEKWQALYGNAVIIDEEVDNNHWVDSVVVKDTPGQLTLPFDKES